MANFNVDTSGNLWIGTGVSDNFSTAQNDSDTKFYVTSAGAIYAVSGHIGGIVIDADGMQSSNYDASSDTGWRFDNNTATVFAYKIDLKIEGGAADPPTVDTQKLDIGSARIYEHSNDLILDASSTNNQVKVKDQLTLTKSAISAGNMQLMFDGLGTGDAMGFWHDSDFPNSSSAQMYWINQSGSSDYNKIAYVSTDDDYFHLGVDAPGIKTDFAGSPTIYIDGPGNSSSDTAQFNMMIRPHGIKDKNGSDGNSGDILHSDGTQVYWASSSGNSHADSDHHDEFYTESEVDSFLSGKANSSHGTHVSYGGNGSASTVSRSDHSHSGGGITSVGMGSSGTGFLTSVTTIGNAITLNTTNTDNSTIHVGSLDPSFSTSDIGNSNSDRFADIYAANHHGGIFYGTLINSSSQNVKENVAENTLGLDFINSMVTKEFNYITKDHSDLKYTGMIAEDLKTVLSDNSWDGYYFVEEIGKDKYQYFDRCSHVVACSTSELENDYYCEDECCDEYFKHTNSRGETRNYLHHTVEECEEYEVDSSRHPHINYYQFIGPLIKSIQELSTQISDLTARIEVLEG
tara:strand:+ start:23184 stop:24902 length:1719 start_codon:yes stop_codon:yes gene_type:complete